MPAVVCQISSLAANLSLRDVLVGWMRVLCRIQENIFLIKSGANRAYIIHYSLDLLKTPFERMPYSRCRYQMNSVLDDGRRYCRAERGRQVLIDENPFLTFLIGFFAAVLKDLVSSRRGWRRGEKGSKAISGDFEVKRLESAAKQKLEEQSRRHYFTDWEGNKKGVAAFLLGDQGRIPTVYGGKLIKELIDRSINRREFFCFQFRILSSLRIVFDRSDLLARSSAD
ncbi:hypothetical protein KFK09_009051 [Dendrobium nobile]|uniref:Uncharacterized protein n=1 Tax=Dendrobium nobile TaxID=94219 RepID=A0A8T3BPP5_DENNO|nr:hypothetical protein KFK09_009051 [Dendrobium nobile]